MNKKISEAMEIIFPRRCPVCSRIIIPKGAKICPECSAGLPYISGNRCLKCGLELDDDGKTYCDRCKRHMQEGMASHDNGMVLFTYNEAIRKSISGYKYRNHRENADFYAEEIVRVYGDIIKSLKPDAIVPVPIHFTRLWERGYNQASLVAVKIAEKTGIFYDGKLLYRDKMTKRQKDLSPQARLKNLQDAFSARMEIGNGRADYDRVLLVDDIYTTGSTIEACTRTLLMAGIRHVDFVTVAGVVG